MWGKFGDEHPKTGFKETEETKMKKSKALKGKKKTQKHKKALSEYHKNRKFVECPWCNKIGKEGGNMTRYHFDNCKEKK